MYSLEEIQTVWQETINPMVLRQFIGNPEMGWKVAWSDRMVSMYASILVFAWLWYPLRKRLKLLPWWAAGAEIRVLRIGVEMDEAEALQAGVWPNPDLGAELENFGGSGAASGSKARASSRNSIERTPSSRASSSIWTRRKGRRW